MACSSGSGPAGPEAGPPAGASAVNTAVATSLDSFEGEEEPTVVYHPGTGGFTSDPYDNMTEPSPGLFRFVLRYRAGDWWDGDRGPTRRGPSSGSPRRRRRST